MSPASVCLPQYWSFATVYAVQHNRCLVLGECALVRRFAIQTDMPFCRRVTRPEAVLGGARWPERGFAPGNYTWLYDGLRATATELGLSQPSVVGDFSATLLTCACCARAVHYFAPAARIIALLRHPIRRMISQLVETRALLSKAFNAVPPNRTTHDGPAGHLPRQLIARVGADVTAELRRLPALRRCLYGHHRQARSTIAEGVADGEVEEMARVECTRGNRPIGHSIYGVTVPPWRRRFPHMLILRNEDLEHTPADQMRRVETFLGLPPHRWDAKLLRRRYNPSACRHGKTAAMRDRTCSGATPLNDAINGSSASLSAINSNSHPFEPHLDVPRLLEALRPPWWEVLESFFSEPGHQLAGFEYF